MRRTATEAERQKRERSLWYGVLTAVAPLFAAALTAAFVLLCATYGAVRPTLTIELGETSPEARAFARTDADEMTYALAPDATYRAAGDYRLSVHTGSRAVPVFLRVRDTEAPTAQGVETTVSIYEAPTPDKLIKNLRDQSVVRVSFETAPDYGTVGDYEAVVALSDASGNRTLVPVTVHVRVAKDAVTLEAGDPAPDAEALLIGTYEDVRIDPITVEMMGTPGVYPIRVVADGVEAITELHVEDTVAPTGSGTTHIALPGETVKPEQLVKDVSDNTAVRATFLKEPDPDCRTAQTVRVLLTDLGGNETEVESTLLVSGVKPSVIEARNTPLAAEELLDGTDGHTAELLGPFLPNVPGMHVIAVLIDGEENLAVLDVRDTTPPEITPSSGTHYLDTPVGVDALVDVSDVSEATAAFVREPDWSLPSQDVTVEATDASGNQSTLTFTLTLVPDAEPPKLYGAKDRYCYVGEPVAYLAEVSAADNCDGAIDVAVDASKVDPTRKGNYPVTYTATDRAGNAVTKTVTFRFVAAKVSDERAQAVADKIIAKILTDDMTLAEQIEAIYDYVFRNVRYSARSNKQDWRSEAVRGLTTGRGDCFTSYAAARLLLERTDAQIISVQRYPNPHHYWLLVNIGTGWYHFDACRAYTGKRRCFMWTDAQTRRYSRSYWSYDKSLYPPVATEPFDGGN